MRSEKIRFSRGSTQYKLQNMFKSWGKFSESIYFYIKVRYYFIFYVSKVIKIKWHNVYLFSFYAVDDFLTFNL